MAFSYNLVLALFLLAPGFGAFAGLFFSSHNERRVHPAPPAPTSVLTLTLVSLAALALHAVWALVLFGQDLWTGADLPHFSVPFEPNIYAVLLNAGHKDAPSQGGGEIAAALLTLAGLSLVGYFVTSRVILSKAGTEFTRPFLFGWAASLLEQINDEPDPKNYVRLVTAFVLTNIEGDGALFGYEGLLQNLTLTPEKQITSVSLSQVTAFYVKLAPGHFKRVVLPRTKGIPDIYLPKDQIRNVSFTVFRVPVQEDLREEAAAVSAPVSAAAPMQHRALRRVRRGRPARAS